MTAIEAKLLFELTEELLKTNSINILLHTEITNDYTPKQLKQKKKKRAIRI